MELFERIKAKRTEQVRNKIARKAGDISTKLATMQPDTPGPYPYEVGTPPLGYQPEGYVRRIAEQVEAHTAGTFCYDALRTHIACADESVIRADQWPAEVKPSLTLVFNRAA